MPVTWHLLWSGILIGLAESEELTSGYGAGIGRRTRHRYDVIVLQMLNIIPGSFSVYRSVLFTPADWSDPVDATWRFMHCA